MFTAGFFIVPLASIVVALACGSLRSGWLALAVALVFPPLAAAALYWLPVLGAPDKSEYAAWFGVFAIPWLIAAWPAALAVTLAMRWRRRRRLKPAAPPAKAPGDVPATPSARS